ncbi:hypothetical protein IB277_31215 [Ensifer sp. ENS07]|jgi:ABC-type sugar transport system permease subunit|uniref:Lipopolysaccharide assembly protein A domain-containing protein n=1 Tax=Ensifer adhaerens TaxID=106592 RepID=A0A9Q8Y5M9_ENSAD|nr:MULTISPECIES: hypothetical protein [Ensifer]MBD9593537.1 hypothetical protein [Ensifer sp. ENS05]MBD9640770.1 hypothetical protein [Ensifer sp. ENS07]USJ22772.1 hypothetical protein NE863_15965 [Ensifer adhaerens]UTV36093.1 hypothetical protein MYG64_16350 [Ensifer adhaerens]SDL93929.1 hypothetical protein SAMN05216328_104355 [Ensifer sp. YR511]
MGKLLQIIAIVIILAALAAAIALLAADPATAQLRALVILPWALSAILSGILLAAFGSMLRQLSAIRAATERQAALFQAILDRRAPTAAQ